MRTSTICSFPISISWKDSNDRSSLMKFLALAISFAIPLLAFAAPSPDASAKLHDLFDREWKWAMSEYPLYATAVGVHDYDDRLGSVSDSDEERRAAKIRGF